MSTDNPASEIAESSAAIAAMPLDERLTKAASAIYIAVEKPVADDISAIFQAARAEIRSLTAQLAKCREALQPFAAACHLYEVLGHDGDRVTSHVAITVGDLRRAKQVFIRALSTGERQ